MSKMRIDILSAVPETFYSVLNSSILKIANKKGLAEIIIHNLHEYSDDKYRHIDDSPYGGAAGMIISCEPVFRCIEGLQYERHYDEIIYMSADGEPLKQTYSNYLSMCENIIILCGHYKGIDQRIRDHFISKEISIGDYVLSGGELPALVLADSVIRLIPGVLGDSESGLTDSFQNGLLESPNYTKPAEYRGMKVPDILLSGNHKEIEKWRTETSYNKTKLLRPDLLED